MAPKRAKRARKAKKDTKAEKAAEEAAGRAKMFARQPADIEAGYQTQVFDSPFNFNDILVPLPFVASNLPQPLPTLRGHVLGTSTVQKGWRLTAWYSFPSRTRLPTDDLRTC